MRRVAFEGSRSDRRLVRSATVEEAGTGIERVEGRPRPGKEVRRMLSICGAMVEVVDGRELSEWICWLL